MINVKNWLYLIEFKDLIAQDFLDNWAYQKSLGISCLN